MLNILDLIIMGLIFVVVLLMGRDFGYDKVLVIVGVLILIGQWNTFNLLKNLARKEKKTTKCDFCDRLAEGKLTVKLPGHEETTSYVCTYHREQKENDVKTAAADLIAKLDKRERTDAKTK